jgi:hypothetical protein
VEHSHSYGNVQGDLPFDTAFTWEVSAAQTSCEDDPSKVFKAGADVKTIHPIYIIPHEAARRIRQWFLERPLYVDGA